MRKNAFARACAGEQSIDTIDYVVSIIYGRSNLYNDSHRPNDKQSYSARWGWRGQAQHEVFALILGEADISSGPNRAIL